jgi:hypothetical protein
VCSSATDDQAVAYGRAVLEPLQLRNQAVPEVIVVVRLGVVTLDDHRLEEACDRSHQRWGIWGFSVLEVPDGDDFDHLVRLRPEVGERRRILIAHGADLISAGFPLLPTLDYPHWTVQLSEATSERFAVVRGVFRGPVDNPGYGD